MKSLRLLILSWLYRISLPIYLYLTYWQLLEDGIDINSVKDMIIIFAWIFAILIFIGGFMKRENLSRTAGILMIILSVIAVYKGFSLLNWFFIFFISLYFVLFKYEQPSRYR